MKKDDLLIRILSIVMFVAMLSYIGVAVVHRIINSVQTAMVVQTSYSESASLWGIVIRDEKIIQTDKNYVDITAEEGEKISSGGVVAYSYDSEDALNRELELSSLLNTIQKAETALQNQKNPEKTSGKIYTQLLDFAKKVKTQDYSELNTDVLEEILLEDKADNVTEEYIQKLKEQYETKSASSYYNQQEIITEESGIFSHIIDGFESVTLETVSQMTPAQLQSLLEENKSADNRVIGKLITGIYWFYAATVDKETAEKLEQGDIISISFSRYSSQEMSAEVEVIGPETDGNQTVILKMKEGMEDLLAARKTSADIIFNSCEGLRIPTKAIYRYYAGYILEKDAQKLALGQKVSIRKDNYDTEAVVSMIEKPEEMEGTTVCQVVFCWPWNENNEMPEDSETEILIESESFSSIDYYTENPDRLCVYTQTGLTAERRKISLIYVMGDYALVDSEGDNGLREGNEVIVQAKTLYEGKVFD